MHSSLVQKREYLIDKLQLIQNAAAKVLTKSKKFNHMIPTPPSAALAPDL